MIYNLSLGPLMSEEAKVQEYLEDNKFSKVLDLGGVHRPWARPWVTHYADLITPDEWAKRYTDMRGFMGFWDKKFMLGDLDSSVFWDQIRAEGPFDFVICSQMLEHSLNPAALIQNMYTVADRGFISVPHFRFEMSRGVQWGTPFRGVMHHRWICAIRGGEFKLFPKLGFIEYMKFKVDDLKTPIPECSFWWEEEIPLTVIDDSFFGHPEPKEGMDFFQKELDNFGDFG